MANFNLSGKMFTVDVITFPKTTLTNSLTTCNTSRDNAPGPANNTSIAKIDGLALRVPDPLPGVPLLAISTLSSSASVNGTCL